MKPANVAVVNLSMSNQDYQCYNCNNLNNITEIFCQKCNFIQPPLNMNHFSRLGVGVGFNVDKEQLENTYLTLQKMFHPDLYINKTEIEKNFAFKHSLLLNQAYTVIKSNLKRSEYLLSLNNIKVNIDDKDAISPDPELLNEIFELQNDITETTDTNKLKILINDIEKQKKHIYKDLAQLFETRQYLAAAHLTIKLNFLNNLRYEPD